MINPDDQQKGGYIQHSKKYASFKYVIPDTTLEVERKLEILEDLRIQNLEEWLCSFQEAKELCQWKGEEVTRILKALIHPRLHVIFEGKRTAESIIDKLLSAVYPKENYYVYLEELKLIRQDRFKYIHEYREAIKRKVAQIGFCQRWKADEIKKKTDEVLMQNLTRDTLLEMTKSNIRDPTQIMEVIERTEKLLPIRQATKTPGNSFKREKSWTREKIEQPKDRHSGNRWGTKKEDYKKKQTYSKDYQRSSSVKKEEKLVSYTEGVLLANCRINSKSSKCLIDTGAMISLMSRRLAQELDLKTSVVAPMKVFTINRKPFILNEEVTTKIATPGIREDPFQVTFKLTDSICDDIVIGADFLKSNAIVVDLATETLEIKPKNPSPEEQILEKVECKSKKKTLEEAESKPQESVLQNEETPFQKTEDDWKERISQLVQKLEETQPVLGKVKGFQHEIIVQNWKPVKVPDYSLPYEKRIQVDAELSRLLQLKVIKESRSKYISPAFPLVKKDGSIRLCVDYRNLNQYTQKDHFPLPDLQESLNNLGGNTVFSTIDLNTGYYQVPVKKEHRQFTSFVVNGKQFEFRRMPFGVCNEPATFQGIMNKILQNVSSCKVYLDDIIVYSRTLKEHYVKLKEVLEKLAENGATVNFKKSHFAQDKINFLGNEISAQGRRPDVTRVNSYNFKEPKTKRQLQSFLGFVNWFRPYIRNLSEQILRLTDKIKQKSLDWTTEDTVTALKVLQEIKKKTLLSHADYSGEFRLECDASDRAIGSLLSQNGKALGFYSKKLTEAETRYTIVEKELLSIVRGLVFFKKIICNRPVTLITDNKNLVFEKRSGTKRYERWVTLLQEFNYKMEHASGQENAAADHLSRVALGKKKCTQFVDLKELSKAQKDEEILKSADAQEKYHKIVVEDTELFVDEKERIYVPKELFKRFVETLHKKLGHPGPNKLYKTIWSYYCAPGLYSFIRNNVKRCYDCQKNKTNTNTYGKSAGNIIGENAFSWVCSDITGPFPSQEYHTSIDSDKFFILTIVDTLTKFTDIKITEKIDEETVLKFLTNWIQKHGSPTRLITDNGRQYSGKSLSRFCRESGIHHTFTSRFNPQSNSCAEILNKTISNAARMNKGKTFKELESQILNNLNLTFNKSTGYAPYECVYQNSAVDLLKRKRKR